MNFFLIKDHHHHHRHRNVVEKKNASSKKMASKQNNISRYAGKIESWKNVYGKINFSFIWRLWYYHYNGFRQLINTCWFVNMTMRIASGECPSIHFHISYYFLLLFVLRIKDESLQKTFEKVCVCDITWVQVIDLHIKNDYDSVIAFQRFHSGQGRQQRKFHFNVRIDDTFSFLKRNYIATFQTIREWNQSLVVIKNFLLSISIHGMASFFSVNW